MSEQFHLKLWTSVHSLKTDPFQTIQLSISTLFSFIWPIGWTLASATTPGQKWTWERWQWRDIPHCPKLQHYWNLTIRLFSVLSRTLVGVVSPFCKEEVRVFSSVCRLGKLQKGETLPSPKKEVSSDKTKLHQIVRLPFWSCGKCGVPFIVITPNSTLTHTGKIC